jgi:hypothetical protein
MAAKGGAYVDLITALVALAASVAILAALGLAAQQWGTDSRPVEPVTWI